MGTTRVIQNALNSGELSPRLQIREDYERYANGLKVCQNFQPLPTGGITTQYGQRYIAPTKDNALAYLIPFESSTSLSYMLEFGHLYIRFFRDGGRIYDLNGTISAIADNGSGLIRVTTGAAHGLTSTNYVFISGVVGTDEANGEWIVTVIDATHIDLVGSAFVHTYSSGGLWNRPYTLVTTYTLASIPGLKFAQSGDTLYIVHPLFSPKKLVRTSHTSWALSAITFLDGPYYDPNLITPGGTISTITITPSAATGGVTLTASSALWVSTDVGRLVRTLQTGVWGYAIITGYTSSTVVNATVINTLTSTAAKTIWRLGAWGTTPGFPSAITIFEQRLCFAATVAEPQRIWLSTTGSYEDMSPSATGGTVAQSDAVTYQLGSNKVNKIQWLSGAQQLYIGTLGEEFSMQGSGLEAVSAINPPIVRSGSTEGSADLAAVRIGSRVAFAQRSGRELREMSFADAEQSLVTEELSLNAEHMFRNPLSIVTMAYQNKPNRMLWVVRSDGALLGFCNYLVEKVRAWAEMESQAALGLYKWVAVIPSVDLKDDQAWFIMNRTIGGVAKYMIEMQDQATSVHCGLTYTGSSALAVSGLDHLNGETVKIVGNGAVYDDQVVVRGSVDLAYGSDAGPAASNIIVGLAITPNPNAQTLQPSLKDNAGSTRYKLKHWASIAVELEETLGLTINNKTQIQYRVPSNHMDHVEPDFTGTKLVANLGWSPDGTITFEQTLPLPATILGYSGELEVAD